MKKLCPICGDKISMLSKVQISDNIICIPCSRICSLSPLATTEAVKKAWEENHRRFQSFEETMKITEIGSGYIFIDMPKQYAYISNRKKHKLEPIIFAFSEIEKYRLEMVGEKVITKTKGGIGRAVVGGVLFGGVGAIVGASTAKQETKTTGGTPRLIITLNLNGLKTSVNIVNPPLKASEALDNMMNL